MVESSSDDSDCEGLKRATSRKKADETFKKVPEKKKFKFNINTGEKTEKFSYKLKKDTPLPYKTYVEDFEICFSVTLKPSLKGYLGTEEDDWWIFRLDSQKSHSGTYSPAVMNSSVDLDKSARSCQEESFNASDITLDSQDDLYDNFTDESHPQDMEVVLFRGLPYQLMNCVRLFNLVYQYGGVKRITFLTGSGMEVDSCRVVMSSSREASQLQKSLFNQEIFGEILQVDLANLGDEDYNSLDVDLEDGSPSWKLFEDERIAWPEVSFAPSKVLQISGMGQMSLDSLLKLFGKYAVKTPVSTDLKDGKGKLHFSNLMESANALIMINNRKILDSVIKLAFADKEKAVVSVEPTAEDPPKVSLKPTVYSPDWMRDLKENFANLIVKPCSERTRSAVDNNEDIENLRDHESVKTELLRSICSKLQSILGVMRHPVKSEMRELVYQLSYEYPNMFREGTVAKHPVDRVETLSNKMMHRYRGQIRREAEKAKPAHVEEPGEDDTEEEPVAKKGAKHKRIYAVDNSKWYKVKKMKPDVAARIANTTKEQDFARREAVFEENREPLQSQIRSEKNIHSLPKSLFMDPRHVARQFTYITGAPPLNQEIEKNLKTFIGNLERVLSHTDKTVDFRKDMEAIELVCNYEFDGSSSLKDLHILRLACETFDKKKDSCKLIRLKSSCPGMDCDPPAQSPSPHIVAVLVEKTFIYEVWVEEAKLIGNMDLCTALAAFYHLCFSFNLKYPQEGETLGDLMQRYVAKYGDDSGTKTWKRVDSAIKKRSTFLNILGQLQFN